MMNIERTLTSVLGVYFPWRRNIAGNALRQNGQNPGTVDTTIRLTGYDEVFPCNFLLPKQT